VTPAVTLAHAFDGALLALLALAVGYCAFIHRRLRALRASQDDFAQLIGSFDRSVRQASAGVADLKQLGAEVGASLNESIAVARNLAETLSAASAATRRSGLAVVATPAHEMPRPEGHSLAERELASALRGVR
jgi:Domain of unknown function (DUF6468)